MPEQMGIESIPGVFSPEALADLAETVFWPERARAAIHDLCRTRSTFTADDVWAAMPENTQQQAGLGSILRSTAKEGLCQPSGTWVASNRGVRRNRPVRVWLSLIR
jgi:hypothetical protein